MKKENKKITFRAQNAAQFIIYLDRLKLFSRRYLRRKVLDKQSWEHAKITWFTMTEGRSSVTQGGGTNTRKIMKKEKTYVVD